jgi:hypothetical protein
MQQHDLLKLFAVPLEAAKIEYVITGSVASILYAEPRLTHDIDMVVHLNMQDARRIPVIFPKGEYYCPPEETMLAEIKRPGRAQFNVIHHDSGFKADFFLHGDDPLHTWAFSNKRRMPIDDEYAVWVAPPEYVVIRKLEYFAEGGSDKHLHDIKSIMAVMKDGLDLRFIEMQVSELGLTEVWERIEKVETLNS